MAKPVVFVIGATGLIGSATVQTLSSKYADKLEIRAGVRDPDKAGILKGLTGVTVVKAEMGANRDGLVHTFRGVHALYVVTPGAENRAQLTIATLEAAKEAGVKFILVVSVSAAETDTSYGQQFGPIEANISALGVPFTIVRLPWFNENIFFLKESIVHESTIRLPVDPDVPHTPVAVGDAGKASAAILADPAKHHSKTYHIVSDRHTFGDLADLFSASLGREIKYVRVPDEDAKKFYMELGIPEWRANGGIEWLRLIESGSPKMNEPDLSHFEQITGEKPTSIKTWVSQIAGEFKT